MPVTVNCSVVPIAMLGPVGVISRDTSVAGVTVSAVAPETPPSVAVIVAEPEATGAARPIEPAVSLMLATADDEELQTTLVVRFCVELSEYVPVATNCWIIPSARLGFAGDIAMETSVAGVTAIAVDPETAPNVAVIDALPGDAGVTSPRDPVIVLTLAMDGEDEFHVTSWVKFCVELSEKVPVAANCSVVPIAILELAGVTAMDCRVAGVIVNVVQPDMFPFLAVMVFLHGPLSPIFPKLIIMALIVSDDPHVTDDVMSWVELSENIPVAENCAVVPAAIVGFVGVTSMATSWA